MNDTISNEIPPNVELDLPDYHPCSVCKLQVPPDCDNEVAYIHRDHRLLAEKCQYHRHSATCYKYDIHSCRFDMDEKNFHPILCFDPETGELSLRCLDGLVNNFNVTILDCIRCNMDIKFVGSGQSTKAILYYITDYIMKSQLKTHVAYAALELAVTKLGEYDPSEDELTFRAKHMLQRCAYAMLSHQELSAPQVILYLMNFDDHFTSHKFVSFNWSGPESYVDKTLPVSDYAVPMFRSSQSADSTSVATPVHVSYPDNAGSPSSPHSGHSALSDEYRGLDANSESYDVSLENDVEQSSSMPAITDNRILADPEDKDIVLNVNSSNNLIPHSRSEERRVGKECW